MTTLKDKEKPGDNGETGEARTGDGGSFGEERQGGNGGLGEGGALKEKCSARDEGAPIGSASLGDTAVLEKNLGSGDGDTSKKGVNPIESGTPKESASPAEDPVHKKTPLVLKILSVLLILGAVLSIPVIVFIIVATVGSPVEIVDELGITTTVITAILVLALMVSVVLGAILGIALLRNRNRYARRISELLMTATVASLLCELMLDGLNLHLLYYLIWLGILIATATYIDPALSEERKVQRKLRNMETRDEAEDGTLGRDTSGKGYIKLDFFNIFWIFVLACVIGLILETIYQAINFGTIEDRAGMLYGPFSPIYGFGAVLMTMALNRFYKRNIILIFLVSALIGGAFEYAVSWFLQFAFGIVAWDYTGSFLSIDGRTNAEFMLIWGVLGCLWIKFLLPYVLKLVNLIPWNWRYSITTVCAALMIANGVLTLAAYDSWYKRQAGEPPENALEEFCDEYYGDEFMENRFQTMSIDPSQSTRGSDGPYDGVL